MKGLLITTVAALLGTAMGLWMIRRDEQRAKRHRDARKPHPGPDKAPPAR
jgi:hypothetical protein